MCTEQQELLKIWVVIQVAAGDPILDTFVIGCSSAVTQHRLAVVAQHGRNKGHWLSLSKRSQEQFKIIGNTCELRVS